MTDLKHQAALAALNKMMRDGHFSICTIDNIAKMLDVIPDPAAYATLRPLHCVDYSDMPRELYASLPTLIQQALSGAPVFQFQLSQPEPLNLTLGAGQRGEPATIESATPRRGLLRFFPHA